MLESFKRRALDESAQGLPEYALLTAAVVVMVVAMGWMWTAGDVFDGIEEWIRDKNAMKTASGTVSHPGGGGGPDIGCGAGIPQCP